jgi:hypothetical protein
MAVTLHLDEAIQEALSNLPAQAMTIPEGAQMDDYFAPTLWGDLDRFRLQVYEPLQGSPQDAHAGTTTFTLNLDSTEAQVVRDVVAALAESWTGGIPWAALTPDERATTERVAARLAK